MKYFIYPFGTAGTLTPVPDGTQSNGTVSYQSGFPVGYELIDTDPASLNIPRDQFNQLMNDITASIQQIQQYGIPYFITSAMNGGTAYPYAKNAIVYQPVDSNVYQSLVANNTTTPPSSSWQLFSAAESSQWLNFSADTGSANAYVVAPSPAITAYTAGDVLVLNPKFANTGASTINVNGLGTQSIKTQANADVSAGMLVPSGQYILVYNGTNFVVTNPTLPTAVTAFQTIKTQKFSTSGTYTPSVGMLYCIVEAVGAGGGGAGCNNTGSPNQGGCGGGGEYARAAYSATSIGASQTVTIGIAGGGGATGANNGSGGSDTSLGILLIAKGGAGGITSGSGGAGGTGGTVSTGGTLIAGKAGGSGFGGSGGASYFGYGGSASLLLSILQQGQGTVFESGAGGQSGTGYGGGGSGSYVGIGAASSQAGGSGSGGYMIITEYCSS